MKAKYSRVLVVDASVARSAGETEHPVSSSCRNALLSILNICHRIVMTEAIREEWRRHASKFARKWLVSMHAKKKVVKVPPSEGTHVNLAKQTLHGLSASKRENLQKDLCLIEAACDGDGIVVTRDDMIVKIWHKCHDRLGLSKPIKWINPMMDDIQTLECL